MSPWSSHSLRGFDDLGEGIRFQTGATHKSAIDFRLRHQFPDVVRLDAAAVQDSQPIGSLLPKRATSMTADDAVRPITSSVWLRVKGTR